MTMVRNVHERWIAAAPEAAGAVLDSLTGPDDRLWPHGLWPSIRMDRPLAVGATGGHGPIRYWVEAYEPGRRVRFRFSDPDLLDGWHAFEVEPRDGGVVFRHVLEGRLGGRMRLLWPLAIRWLHDAVVEDGFDRAETALTGAPRNRASWSPWVRFLRARLAGGRSRPEAEVQ